MQMILKISLISIISILIVGCATFHNYYVYKVSMTVPKVTVKQQDNIEKIILKLADEYGLKQTGTVDYKGEKYDVYDKPYSNITIFYLRKSCTIEARAVYKSDLDTLKKKLKTSIDSHIGIKLFEEKEKVISRSLFDNI